MNRKAELAFSTLLLAFYELIVLFLVALAMVFFVNHFMKASLDVFQVESEVFVQGLINSKNGISYRENGRVYPGIIDAKDFKDAAVLRARLDKAFYFASERKPIAARIEVLKGTQPYPSLQPVVYNPEWFTTWHAFGKTLVPGAGSAKVLEKLYPVMVKDGNSYDKAILKVTVAIPNS